MLKKVHLLVCRIRLFVLKAIHNNSIITTVGFSNISEKTSIEVGKHSVFFMGRGLHTRAGVVLSVRDNASLIIGNGVFINRNTIITSRYSITIEDEVTIGPNVCIYDHNHNICGCLSSGGGMCLIVW